MKEKFFICLLGVLLLCNANPIDEKEISKQDNIVSYIQNFKDTMAGYVYGQHKDLPEKSRDAIKNALEDFLVTFANDLKTTVESPPVDKIDIVKIEDGLPDTNFQLIRDRIQKEFPDVTADMATEIVYKLRKNLYVTKQRLDQIIADSITTKKRNEPEV